MEKTKNDITVACVYWKGKFRRREELYDVSWVEKLQNMVARNLKIPHRFVCLSNTEVPCERIPLKHNWPGYWSKIELFRPGLFEGRVLYLDLDTLILKNLSPLIASPDAFTMIKGYGIRRAKEGKLLLGKYNSSAMVWDSEFGEQIYHNFIWDCPDTMMKKYMGDQEYITQLLDPIPTFPKGWIKKLKDCPDYTPDENMIVALCMLGASKYGKNKRALEEFEWVKEVWQ